MRTRRCGPARGPLHPDGSFGRMSALGKKWTLAIRADAPPVEWVQQHRKAPRYRILASAAAAEGAHPTLDAWQQHTQALHGSRSDPPQEGTVALDLGQGCRARTFGRKGVAPRCEAHDDLPRQFIGCVAGCAHNFSTRKAELIRPFRSKTRLLLKDNPKRAIVLHLDGDKLRRVSNLRC